MRLRKPFAAYFCPLIPRIGDVLAKQPQRALVPARRRDRDRPRPGPQVADERLRLGRASDSHGYCPANPASPRTTAARGPIVASSPEEPAPLLPRPPRQHRLEHRLLRVQRHDPLRQLQPRAARQLRQHPPQTPRCIRRNIDARRVTDMTSRLNNPKSPRVTTPTPPHQANSSPYRTPRNLASAAIKPVSRTRSPSARRAAATPNAPQGLNELEPPAAFGVMARRPQLWQPGTAAISDFHPDSAGAGCYRYRDRLPGKTRAAVPDAVAEKLAREQDSIIPAGVPRAKHRANERADNPRPVPSPGDPHALPNFRLTHQRTCFPVRTETPQERADARKWTLTSAADVKPNMRPGALTAGNLPGAVPHPAHTAG